MKNILLIATAALVACLGIAGPADAGVVNAESRLTYELFLPEGEAPEIGDLQVEKLRVGVQSNYFTGSIGSWYGRIELSFDGVEPSSSTRTPDPELSLAFVDIQPLAEHNTSIIVGVQSNMFGTITPENSPVWFRTGLAPIEQRGLSGLPIFEESVDGIAIQSDLGSQYLCVMAQAYTGDSEERTNWTTTGCLEAGPLEIIGSYGEQKRRDVDLDMSAVVTQATLTVPQFEAGAKYYWTDSRVPNVSRTKEGTNAFTFFGIASPIEDIKVFGRADVVEDAGDTYTGGVNLKFGRWSFLQGAYVFEDMTGTEDTSSFSVSFNTVM